MYNPHRRYASPSLLAYWGVDGYSMNKDGSINMPPVTSSDDTEEREATLPREVTA